MKKILLSLSVFTALATQAQLTQLNHTPSFWDPAFSINQCDTITSGVPGATGAGALWSYTPTVHTSMLKTYTTAYSTDASFNPADAVVKSSSTDGAYYRTNSATSLSYYGGNISTGPITGVAKYTSPAIVAAYPMALNTSTNSATSGNINITSPFPASLNFTGNCNALADATGTLVLPGRTYSDIIRLTTTQNLFATGATSATITLVTYDYYSEASAKAPVLSVQCSTVSSALGTSSQTITTLQQNYVTVGLNDARPVTTELSVYPNPASSVINFSTAGTEAYKVTVYDVTGKVVATELFEESKTKLNISSLNNGIYLYTVSGKNNQVLNTGKFNVSR
jgi:hypothetical protein